MKPKIKATCTKLQLQLLSFCLLCLTGKTRCDGNGPPVVKVEQGSDAVLPCSLSTKENIESKLFDWKKPAQKDEKKKVFFYNAGITRSGGDGQSEEFKGRVSHFQEELKHGNASINIRNTKVTDSGDYTCDFPNLQPRQTFHIKLVVGATSEPNIRTLDQTRNSALLQCKVTGDPQPEVEWQDSAGNTLPAQKSLVLDRNGGFIITLKTTVTKTGNYRCVATQETISHQISTETFVRINGPTHISVYEGDAAPLPCSLSTKENIESKIFEWKKDGQKEVFFYNAGILSNNGRSRQSEEFKDRVSHFPDNLKHGDASIIIRNTKLTDSGNYTCVFPDLQPRQTFHIELVVVETGAHSSDPPTGLIVIVVAAVVSVLCTLLVVGCVALAIWCHKKTTTNNGMI